jgi:glyoxylase-like metal-dependent hydrolase (beta-lactamase superfamily II)
MDQTEIAAGPTYHLQLYLTGTCWVKGRYAFRHYAKDRDHPYAIYIGVIRGADLVALVDTGMASVEEMNRGAGFLLSRPITQQPGEDTLSILARAGVSPSEVGYVFLTHCHYDHCSNLPLFPHAQVVIPETAWRVWHSEPQGAAYLHAGFLEHLHTVHAEGRLLLMDEGLVVPGIGVRRVGGHSPCSQFIYVNTQRGVGVLTGDTVQMYANLEQDDTVGIWMDDDECRQALAIARSSAGFVLPGHDPRIWEQYRDGVVA